MKTVIVQRSVLSVLIKLAKDGKAQLSSPVSVRLAEESIRRSELALERQRGIDSLLLKMVELAERSEENLHVTDE